MTTTAIPQSTTPQRIAQYHKTAAENVALPSHTLQTLLNLLLCSWFMQECIDALRGTTYDAKGLKMRLNQLEPEVKKAIDRDLDLLWGNAGDDATLYALMDGVKLFFGDFAKMRPEQLAGFHELFKRFKAAPEQVMASMDIQVVESKNPGQTKDMADICNLLKDVADISAIKWNLKLVIQNQLNKEALCK